MKLIKGQEFKIKCADIDKFDINFEELRKKNPDIIGVQEPGDMVSAPYYHQHQTATVIEKLHIKKRRCSKIVTDCLDSL